MGKFDFDEHLLLFMNSAVWDIDNGVILKLSENKEVLHAIKGYRRLEMTQIKAIYGDPPIYKHLKWPDTNIQINRKEGAHWTLMSFSDAYKVPLICHIVHHIGRGDIKKKTFKEFAFELYELTYR